MNTSHPDDPRNHHILIMAAVEAECEAIRRGIPAEVASRITVKAAGVGPAAAAVSTTLALSAQTYHLVISAGIGGGFAPHAPIGSIVLADQIIAADLGSETAEQGFLSVDELGFGQSVLNSDATLTTRLEAALISSGLSVYTGPALTVSTTTGSAASTAALLQRIPNAACEGMEGFGVAVAAQAFHLPVLELRAISNAVGPRDRDSWNIPAALQSLTQASRILAEVL
ncbi:futalosine hydrolase [Paenibacillus kandeliae]|uniref:futalosine hydrolase n=1 Tax=Paenibacillus kandeliae TaxID=3231269 RepID=UPI0034590D24